MSLIDTRQSGVFLPLASLPGSGASGRCDEAARWFIDSLSACGQSFWQVLPLNTMDDFDCPYTSTCASTIDPLYIDPDYLVKLQLITKATAKIDHADSQHEKIQYWKAREETQEVLRQAFGNFQQLPEDHPLQKQFSAFCSRQKHWLDDYALFQALSRKYNTYQWQQWPQPLASYERAALNEFAKLAASELTFEQFCQFVVEGSWQATKDYAHSKGLKIIGDIPIYVSLNSADVWAHQSQFELDNVGYPTQVSGVPPDQMCPEGQKWGHPLYRWETMQAHGYEYWLQKLSRMFELFDTVRLDHFIGFCRYFAIPLHESADKGVWRNGPGASLFSVVEKHFPQMPFIAEDLGSAGPDVFALRDQFHIPGMGVFIFGFDPADRSHHPSNIKRAHVYYSSTHDTQTLAGWLRSREDATDIETQIAASLQLIAASAACLTLYPIQDLLGLDDSSRINIPGTASGNWMYRLQRQQWNDDGRQLLRELTQHSGRLPQAQP